MKNTTYLIILIAVSSFLVISCSDIINSDNNVIIIPKGEQPGLSKWIEYNFENDGLSFHNNDTTNLWPAEKPELWAKTFLIVNSSQDSIFEIKSLSLADGRYFYLAPAGSFPLKLFPGQSNNSNNLISIFINTQNLSKGIYIDKVIVNNNSKIGFYVKVNII